MPGDKRVDRHAGRQWRRWHADCEVADSETPPIAAPGCRLNDVCQGWPAVDFPSPQAFFSSLALAHASSVQPGMRASPFPVRRVVGIVFLATQCNVLAPCALAAQPSLQDDIDRNLQERRTRAFELRLDLEPGPPPPPAPESEVRRSVVVPRADPGILDRLPRIPQEGRRRLADPPAPSESASVLDSQRRRQQALQAQTRTVPEPQRRRMLDAQQLQFERELRSERLRSEMMRDSGRVLGR